MQMSDELWMWLHHKYEMDWMVWKLYPIEKKCSHLAVTGNGWLNRQNYGWEWWIMKVSASKICNESNHTTITLI